MFQKLLQSDLPIKIALILAGLIVIQFFFINPRKKEEKKRTDFLKKLTIGTQITTIGGIYGKVIKINEHTVTIEIDPRGSNITIKKQAILQEQPYPTKKTKEK